MQLNGYCIDLSLHVLEEVKTSPYLYDLKFDLK